MRLSPSLAFAALLATVAHATPNSALTSRQAGVGLSVDICADLDFVLKVPNFLKVGTFITLGNIKTCLCRSDLTQFCASNAIAVAASALVGRAKVEEIINEQFSGSRCQTCQTCQYPPHSVPECRKGKPCSFTCKDGFVPFPPGNPVTCICKAPFQNCGGKCGNYPSCPSHGFGKRDQDALAGSRKACKHGLSACGVLGRPKAWECVDTQSDLESCGGCAVPLYYGAPGRVGEDCSSLPGVQDVSCVRGGCMVHRCEPGYVPNADRTRCIYDESSDPAVLAEEYGLEHTTW